MPKAGASSVQLCEELNKAIDSLLVERPFRIGFREDGKSLFECCCFPASRSISACISLRIDEKSNIVTRYFSHAAAINKLLGIVCLYPLPSLYTCSQGMPFLWDSRTRSHGDFLLRTLIPSLMNIMAVESQGAPSPYFFSMIRPPYSENSLYTLGNTGP